MSRGLLKTWTLACVVALLGLGSLALAAGKNTMRSTKLAPKLCQTDGGGKFVDIPGFPGEMIDRRLLSDVKWLQRKYKIYVTDGYSTSDVHAWNGEHPIGLALDIVPNKAAGGSWRDITALARWAEPRQDKPRQPFRWVGYDGDSGHGRGHHLHLSWNHSMTKPKRPATTVYTVRCPGSDAGGGGAVDGGGAGGGGESGSGSGSDSGGNGGGDATDPKPQPPTGGAGSGGGSSSGGIGSKRVAPGVVVETGGVDGP